MKYSQGFKEIVERQVPVGGCVADRAYVIGAEILVAVDTREYAPSTLAPFVKRGCVALPPKAGDVPVDGAACYLDAATGRVQATPSETTYLCGSRYAAHPNDDGVNLIGVDLDGTVAGVYGAATGDIEGVIAGTGLEGGGTSGTVTLSVDETVVRNVTGDARQADEVLVSGGPDRTAKASGLLYTDLPTLLGYAPSDGYLVVAAGPGKQVRHSMLRERLEYLGAVAFGPSVLLKVNCEAVNSVITVFSDAPIALRVVDFWVVCTAGNTGGTAKLNDAADGSGTDLTDAVPMEVQWDLERCSSLRHDLAEIPVHGSLSVVKNSADDKGFAYILAVLV